MINRDTFCSLPFKALFIGTDGSVKPCCSYRGSLGNVRQQPLKDIVEGEDAQRLRRTITQGQWAEGCSQCREIESRGLASQREGWDKLDQWRIVTDTYYQLELLDLRWTNTCNLMCVYCDDYFSSRWAEHKGSRDYPGLRGPAAQDIFDYLGSRADNITQVWLLGGEPLLQRANHQLLDAVPNAQYYVLTNLSVDLNSPVAQRLINPRTDWAVSMESLGPRYEYVRHGASWSQLLANLAQLQGRVASISVQPLYCLYSALDLCELYKFFDQQSIPTVKWQMLHNIAGLDVFRNSLKLRRAAVEELDRCIDRWGSQYDMQDLMRVRGELATTLATDYLKNPTESWLAHLDQQIPGKRQQFIDLWPHVWALIKD